MVRYCIIIAPTNVPLRRIGYMGSLEAIERMLGIARGMASGSRVLMRSGSGARVGVVEVVYHKEIAHFIRNRYTLVPGTCLADTKKTT